MGNENQTKGRLALAGAVAAGVIGASLVMAVAERLRSVRAAVADRAPGPLGSRGKRSEPKRQKKRVSKRDRSMMVEMPQGSIEKPSKAIRRAEKRRSKRQP